MSLDPRTPVLVGCGQVVQRAEDPAQAREPLRLMADALERAADDAGARSLLAAADSIRVPRGVWRYENPAAWLAERFGAASPQTGLGPISGSTVQRMVSDAAVEIAAGRRDVVLLAGGEAEHSRRRGKAAGARPVWTDPDGPPPDETFGSHDPGFGPFEMRYRLRPIHVFSLFENALRHARGDSPERNRRDVAELWSRFSRVAAGNEHAWIRDGKREDEIREPGPGNPMVAYPYTKFLVANMVVDMGAGLILCSVGAARRHGVSEGRWIFPQAATDVFGAHPLAERDALHDQPAMRIAGRRALRLARVAPEALAHVDLYSCFPSAVRIAAAEIGLDPARPLTVTGGLTFGGGPFNSYVMHSLATLMHRLRETGGCGLVTGIGGYMQKHAFGVYGARPPDRGFRYEDCTAEALALPRRRWQDDFAGEASVETFAQVPDADGAGALVAALRTDAGARTFARSEDPSLIASVLADEELCGRRARVADDRFEVV